MDSHWHLRRGVAATPPWTRRPPRPGLGALALVLAVAAVACSATDGATTAADARTDSAGADSSSAGSADGSPADTGAPCPADQQLPSGACCPTGQYPGWGTSECVAVGPPGCSSLANSDDCEPQWCCDEPGTLLAPGACLQSARPCNAGETGCPAGSWRPFWRAGACVPAGGVAPEPATPTWCENHGVAGPCSPEEGGCPAGQVPSEEGCAEAAPTWWCPPGFVEAPGEEGEPPGCAPDPDDCLPWEPMAGAIHVDASATGAATGAFDKPFPTITKALGVAPAGGTIFVRAGAYAENLDLVLPVRILGQCAAQVTLTGVKGAPVVSTTDVPGPGQGIVEGMRLRSANKTYFVFGQGLVSAGPLELVLRRSYLDTPTTIGVFAVGAGHVTVDGSVIAGASSTKLDAVNAGAFAYTRGTIVITGSRLTDNLFFGVYAKGDESTITVKDSVIDGSRKGTIDAPGVGVEVSDGATGEIDGLRIARCEGIGVVARGGGALVARGLVVQDTLQYTGQPGVSVVAQEGATLDLRGARLADHPGFGVSAESGGRVEGTGVVIERPHAQATWFPEGFTAAMGCGVQVTDGGHVVLRASRIHDVASAGVFVNGADNRFEGWDLVVDGVATNPSASDDPAVGLWAQGGGTLSLHGGVIAGVHGPAVVATGAALDTEGLLVMGTADEGGNGYGILVGDGGSTHLAGIRVSGAGTNGILATQKHEGSVTGAIVEGTSAAGERSGAGILVHDHTAFDVVATISRYNGAAAVYYTGSSTGTVRGSVLSRSAGGVNIDGDGVSREQGDGLCVGTFSSVDLVDSIVADSARAGVFVLDGGALKVTSSGVARSYYGLVIDADEVVDSQGLVLLDNALADFTAEGKLTPPAVPEVALPSLGL